MSALITVLISSLSEAALAVFARLITKKMFEKLLERLIIAGVNKLAEETNSPLLDEVAAVVKKQLEEKPNA